MNGDYGKYPEAICALECASNAVNDNCNCCGHNVYGGQLLLSLSLFLSILTATFQVNLD